MKNKLLRLLSVAVFSALFSGSASADWKCELVLCMANPSGPTALSQCMPSWNEFMDWQKDNSGFPTCDSSGDTQVRRTGGECPPQYERWVERRDTMVKVCDFPTAYTIYINGQPWSRVWAKGGQTVPEHLTEAGRNSPGASTKFVDDFKAYEIRKAKEEEERKRRERYDN